MDFYEQFQRPIGREGRIIAAKMNKEHYELTTWGLAHVTINPNFRVLDVGCGGGKTVNRLATLVPEGKVYGIDYSPDMVEYARKLNREYIEAGKMEIAEASVDKTAFPNCTFDLVTAVETYYFWPSLPDAFKEIKRILKPNGKLIMVNEMVKDGVYDVEKAGLIEKVHVRLFALQEIQATLITAGFINVKGFQKEQSPWNTIIAEKPSA